jgi:DNA/RNA endonuclease YhcR with UshA esterase domain
MTKLYSGLKALVLLVCFVGMGNSNAWAQDVPTPAFTFTTNNLTHSQNFDVMGATTAYPTGWTAIKNVGTNTLTPGATLTLIVGNGGGNAGGIYNVGVTDSDDRALGSLASAGVAPRFGASFKNNTGSTITQVNLSAFMEQWRVSTTTVLERNIFEYSLDAVRLLNDGAEDIGTWTALPAMDLVEVNEGSTSAALIGNEAANRREIEGVISDINWANGETLWIRWTDIDNIPGSDALLAVDDFSITVTLQATTTPTITLTPTSLAPFTTTVGTASDLQTYTVSGQNLTGNVVVSAPEHMEIRLGAEGAYSNELTLTPVNNTLEGSRIQVRIAATAPVGAISGNITHVSEGSNNPSIAVTGSVNALTPTLTVTGTLTTFTTTTGTASATQSYTVGGTNLTGNVVIEAPEGMELRAGTTGNWSNTLTLTPENNGLATTTIQVRIAANAAVGSIAGNITHVSENSNNPSIAVTGTVAVPAPTISRTGAINPFVALVSKASGIQTYTVSGQNLTSDIVVTAPQGYEVRQGAEGTWGNTVTLTPQSGTVANTGVQVRMAAASATGTVAGNLTIASEGVTAVSAALTGTVVNIVPLSQVKAINAQGQSNIEGEYVVVRGTIHGVNISTAANQHQYTIIDNTDGITIRTISNTVFTGTLAEGDSVEVNGRVETFRGLGQVNLVSRIEKLGQGTIRTPRTVTVLDEATESQLITLRNVTVAREGTSVWANDPASNSATLTGFNVSITTADDVTYLMRITANSPLYGKTYEEVFGTATRVDITGLGGQFATTSAAPFVGGYQIFPYRLTHITAPVTTSLANKMDASQIAVYPNPASDRFVVEASAEGTSTVTVYSITGQRMTSKQFNKSTVIETAGFNSGMYMLHISNGANTVVKKVSVVR